MHGKCKQGKSECDSCDSGWTGKLCDIEAKFDPNALLVSAKSGEVVEDIQEAEIFESLADKMA